MGFPSNPCPGDSLPLAANHVFLLPSIVEMEAPTQALLRSGLSCLWVERTWKPAPRLAQGRVAQESKRPAYRGTPGGRPRPRRSCSCRNRFLTLLAGSTSAVTGLFAQLRAWSERKPFRLTWPGTGLLSVLASRDLSTAGTSPGIYCLREISTLQVLAERKSRAVMAEGHPSPRLRRTA